MKKITLILLLVAVSLTGAANVFAEEPSQMIGTVRYCVEEIQKLPMHIYSAICDKDTASYDLRMAELVDLIQQANDAMQDGKIPNTLRLWNVYTAVAANKYCGGETEAQSRADWAREELDRVGQRIGAIEMDLCPYGEQEYWAPGTVAEYNEATGTYDPVPYGILWTVSGCNPDRSYRWDSYIINP